VQHRQNPSLQNGSKVRFYFTKLDTKPAWFNIQNRCLSLEEFVQMENLHYNDSLLLKRRGSLQETSTQA